MSLASARRLARSVAISAALAFSPTGLHAQDTGLDAPAGEALAASAISAGSPPSCVAALPATAFRRTMVYLVADHAGDPFPRVPEAAFLSLRLTTENVAWQARGLLGAPDGLLPSPDTLINWRNLGRHLHLVGHRDGRITWSFPWDTPGHRLVRDSVGETALDLLARAVDRAMAKNERFAWPDGVEGDSIPFLIRLDYPQLKGKGGIEPMRGQHAAPLLEVRVPVMTPLTPRRMGRISYPERSRERGVTANLVLQFVVDTAGRPIDGSIRDLWPDEKPRPRGVLGGHYAAFLTGVRKGLVESVYNPARVGGCAVAQLVQQPFTFDIAR